METSNLTKERIKKYLDEKEKRFDNRGLLDFRDIEVEEGVSENAESSVRVKIGKTEVVVGVKLDIAEPYPDSEDEGTLKTTVELSPLSGKEYEPGPPGIKATEIARIVDRSVRETGFIDFKGLCIEEGEKVWQIYLDIYTINDDGNLIDASCLGSIIALKNAQMPVYDKDKGRVDRKKDLTDEKLPLEDKVPVTLTFHKIGDKFILDPDYTEEETSEARLSIGFVPKDKKVNALQKGKEKPLSVEEVSELIDSAFENGEVLEEIIKENTE